MDKEIWKKTICVSVALLFLLSVTPVTKDGHVSKINKNGEIITQKILNYIENNCRYENMVTRLNDNNLEIQNNAFTSSNDEIDQQQTETGSGAILCGRWVWAQSFVPTMPVLTRVELLGYKRGIVNDLTISIRKNLYGSNLASVTVKPSEIPSTPTWMEFDFDDINVIPNETYFIVMSTTGGDNRENYYDFLGSRSDVYPYGDGYIGWIYSGIEVWEIWGREKHQKEFDFCFKTYGIRGEYNETEPKEKWTYMLYDDADFENAYDPLSNFEAEVWSGKGFDAVVLQDTYDGPAKIWYIDRYHHRKLLKEMGEVDMGDYTTLREFINYCKRNFPADKYIMDMYNHGGGWWGACWDDTDNYDWLTMDEIQKALKETGGINILTFNAPCLMGNFEAVYEVRDVVDVYIGSEELSGYRVGIASQICELLNHNYEGIDSYELGQNIIKYAKNLGYCSFSYETMSAVRTDKIDDLADSINKLSKDLTLKWLKCYSKVKEAHKNTKRFGMDYADSYQLYDLYDFTEKLVALDVPSKIQQDIKNVQAIFNETVIAEFHGSFEKDSHGLTIYFPDQFMNGTTIYYGSDSSLDFPQDTFWNEFLGLYVLSYSLFP